MTAETGECHICHRRTDEPGALWCSYPHPLENTTPAFPFFEIASASCFCEHLEEEHESGTGACFKCSCRQFVLHPDYDAEG